MIKDTRQVSFRTKIYHPNIDEKGQVASTYVCNEYHNSWSLEILKFQLLFCQVCLPIVSAENWKPATKTDQVDNKKKPYKNWSDGQEKFGFISFCQVIQALVALVNAPEPEHPLRADLAGSTSCDTLIIIVIMLTVVRTKLLFAEEYTKDKKKFFKNAEEFTKKNSEKRPSD